MYHKLLRSYFRILLPFSRIKPKNWILYPKVDRKLHIIDPYGLRFNYSTFNHNAGNIPTGRLLLLSTDHLTQTKHYPAARISMTTTDLKKKTKDNEIASLKNEKKHIPDDSPMILLVDTEDKVSIVRLQQARKLAKRRDLKLVKVEDPAVKKDKDIYKLMSGKQYYEEEVRNKRNAKSSSSSKGDKILTLSSTIAANDLKAKILNINKWLKKGFQIKVTITSKGTKEDLQNIFLVIEEEVNSLQGRILQQREKFNDLKFYIAPSKEDKSRKQEPQNHSNNQESLVSSTQEHSQDGEKMSS